MRLKTKSKKYSFRTKVASQMLEKFSVSTIEEAIKQSVIYHKKIALDKGVLNGSNPPYDPAILASAMGAEVRYSNLINYEGQIIIENSKESNDEVKNIIIEVKKENRSRQKVRFNIAHEVGHLILWDAIGSKRRMSVGHTAKTSEVEKLCDMLAAEILAPRDEVLTTLKKLKFPGTNSALTLFDVSKIFDLSVYATCRRIKELHEPSLRAALFNCNEKKIEWKLLMEDTEELLNQLKTLKFSELGECGSSIYFPRNRNLKQQFDWAKGSEGFVLVVQIDWSRYI